MILLDLDSEGVEMRSSRFPQELYEEIIDHLWDDQSALASCGATCRAWVQTSRMHLFHAISIYNPPRCLAFLEILETSSLAPAAFAPYVRDLTISKEASGYSWEEDWTNEELLPALPYLAGVHTLTLRHLRREDISAETLACLCTFSRNIHTLNLDTVFFRNGNDLRFLLFNHPNLSSISLKSVTWKKSAKVVKGDLGEGEKLKIRKLVVEEVEEADPRFIFRGVQCFLGRCRPGSPLQFHLNELHWASHMSTKGCMALDELLQMSGRSLKHLTIAFHPRIGTNGEYDNDAQGEIVKLPDQFHMFQNTRLRTIHIVCPRDGYTKRQCRWVHALLSRIQSEPLQEVRIVLGSCGFEHFFFDFLNWPLVDEALTDLRARSPDLSVVFQIGRQHEVSNEYTKAAIFSRIPSTIATGIRIGMAATHSALEGGRTISREVLKWGD